MLLLCSKTQQWQCPYEVKVLVSELKAHRTWSLFPLWHQLGPFSSLCQSHWAPALLRCARPWLGFLCRLSLSLSACPSDAHQLCHLLPKVSDHQSVSPCRLPPLLSLSVPVAQPPESAYTAWVSFFYQYLSPSYILSNLLACVYYLPFP